MKRLTMMAVLFCLLALIATAQFGQSQTPIPGKNIGGSSYSAPNQPNNEPETQATLLQRLAAEVRKLRSELLEQRLESQELRITLLKNELEQARATQQQLEEQERTISQEVAEVEKQLGQASLMVADREQLEATKAELVGGLERLRVEQQKLAERKTQLLELLERAEQRRQELLEQARKFAAGIG
jgi:DNA repair exonuclease SbcCD ATPase subunit